MPDLRAAVILAAAVLLIRVATDNGELVIETGAYATPGQ